MTSMFEHWPTELVRSGLRRNMDSGNFECEGIISPLGLGSQLDFVLDRPGTRSYQCREWGYWPASLFTVGCLGLLACSIGLIVMDWITLNRPLASPGWALACAIPGLLLAIPWICCINCVREITIDMDRREVRLRSRVFGNTRSDLTTPLDQIDVLCCTTSRSGYRGGSHRGTMLVLVTDEEAVVLASGSNPDVDEYSREFTSIIGVKPRGTSIHVRAPDAYNPIC